MIAATERNHLGQNFFLGSAEMLRDLLVHLLSCDDSGRIVIHANLHTIYSKSRSQSLRKLLDDFPEKLVFFEGIALKLSRFVCSGEMWPDVNGTDLIPMVLERAPYGTRVAIIGARPDVTELACRRLSARYRNLDIVSRLDGYDGIRHLDAHIAYLNAERPDIVLVGLGTPDQEILAARLLHDVAPKLVWAVGGFLDVASGTAVRAPDLVLAMRLEWLWRLLREPARLWRRTFVEGPWLARKVAERFLVGEGARS
jgi:exopolysaccharide biosynthesis WecB/TagA/CpsF family protein